ncbi:uncharacterized protein LOC116267062 isoform X2 [Nymphaea colorata]|nr:uncharacterized protein LOC116267062 isoform X2 [Nymphaea colorata]XP_031504477.1 uncharacterized protein LOC116267062 isoform X2 [Nymphaea colorata]
MQKIFEALAPESVCSDARNLIEYCCFRYLSRDNSEVHPSLKEPAFQRLIFITMLAWEHPYEKENDISGVPKHNSLQGKLVGEEAFIRIAPGVPGVADRSTAHHLYKNLAGDSQGISLNLWTSFLSELLRVHQGRDSYQSRENASLLLSGESVLCVGSSKKKPVLKWDKNIGWPGKLILTDCALYFEKFGLIGERRILRLDLACDNVKLQKTKVGPMGSAIFDSAVSVSGKSETWVLEFVDLGGEMRRDVWHAFMSEVVSVHKFIREHGPADDDPSLHHVYGSHKGKMKAIKSAANSIARLQSLQFIRRLSDDPAKLMQFLYLESTPGGNIVLQALAVNIWGGPLTAKFVVANHQPTIGMRHYEDEENTGLPLFDIDGSVYLRKWMKSSSWSSASSISFWKNASVREGIVLGKNLVVGGKTLVERASSNCRERSQIIEKTQATIDAAVLEGIPSNIDLLKEILLPVIIIGQSFDKLRRWEKPSQTILFLAFAYILIFRNLLTYVFPSILMFMATAMLVLKGLKQQGRLGRYFGKITIQEQPPSSTIEKFIAIKEALNDVERYFQKLNVILLKVRAIFLASQPQVTTEVALILLFSATVLYTVPFRYIFACLLLDTFTRELEFRKEMVKKFRRLLKERWETIPVTPVIVLPYESDQSKNAESTIRLNETRQVTSSDEKNIEPR